MAASGVALAVAAGAESIAALVPGLVLQGIGLGIVLTVKDPTGLTAVPEDSQGQAAGDQHERAVWRRGGDRSAAGRRADRFRDHLFGRLADQGITVTQSDTERVKEFVFEAEQVGLNRALDADDSPLVRVALEDLVQSHVNGFAAAFYVSAALALVGAVVACVLVRQHGRIYAGRVFSRRSRSVQAHAGVSPAVTRKPAP